MSAETPTTDAMVHDLEKSLELAATGKRRGGTVESGDKRKTLNVTRLDLGATGDALIASGAAISTNLRQYRGIIDCNQIASG